MKRGARSVSRGFSIIESLVVMFLIVLLASIVIAGLWKRDSEEVGEPVQAVGQGELPDSRDKPRETSPDDSPTIGSGASVDP